MKKIAGIVMSETHLPADLMTFTEGSNWGLDGYPDMAYGAGVLDAKLFSEGATTLPDGVVMAGENKDFFSNGDLDYGTFMREGSLTDLSWLELAEQDVDRLPHNPVAESVPELEEAWGTTRRTNGVDALPYRDLESASPVDHLPGSRQASFSAPELRDAMRNASRRVQAGESFRAVALSVAQKLGSDAPKVRKAMLQLKDDAGLLGRVFIRASDYPGCASGQWADKVRKTASTAKYLVAKSACGGCVQNQNGNCSVFKKQLVSAVPWARVAKELGPAMRATGRNIKGGDIKESVRAALSQRPVGMDRVGDVRPVHVVPADRITLAAAQEAFQAAPATETRRVRATTPQAAMAALAAKVQQVKASATKGLRGQKLASYIEATFKGPALKTALDHLMPFLREGHYLDEAATPAFSGSVNSAGDFESTRRLAKLEPPKPQMPKETFAILRWARQKMSEGAAGADLTLYLKSRFASSNVKTASDALAVARSTHEGLSGHAYVDAEAYASPVGTTGCETGGLRHRANTIPTVLEMSRCGSCAKRSRRLDGATMCQVYNKPLIKSASEIIEGDPRDYAREMIRLANGSDAERTAALFSASTFSHSEFRLGEENELDNLTVASVDTKAVSNILFGGMVIEGDD